MKKILLSFLAALSFCVGSYAQSFIRYDDFFRDISLGTGIVAPAFGSAGNLGAETYYSLTVSHFTRRGLGYRFGGQYAENFVGLENAVAFPLAFSYRTRVRSFDDALTDTAYSLFAYDWLYMPENSISSLIFASLFFLFRQTEFNIGLTPGIIFGESKIRLVSTADNEQYWEGVNKRSAFLLTADMACQFNIPIWRFCFYLSPSLHYVLTDNFQLVERYGTSNIRWLFSATAGIKFAF